MGGSHIGVHERCVAKKHGRTERVNDFEGFEFIVPEVQCEIINLAEDVDFEGVEEC